MKIYFNRYYKGKPYRNLKKGIEFDSIYCGDNELIQLLMLHGGLVPPQTSPEERQAFYHNNLKKKDIKGSLFEKSFELDSFATACRILSWRDALVSAGWNLKDASSPKLDFIKKAEPENLPRGMADCVGEIIRLAECSLIFPPDAEVIVTQKKECLDPVIKHILGSQENFGVKVSYQPLTDVEATGDLGKLQKWMLEKSDKPIHFENDGSISIMHFHDDEEALKYVATLEPDSWELYFCQQSKQFDNVLKYLSQPTCGSDIGPCIPQVVQLFTLGNGSFEIPLNIERILAWLNATMHPIPGDLKRRLATKIATDGGLAKEEWNTIIDEYVAEKLPEPEKQKKLKNQIKAFLPFLLSEPGGIKVTDVMEFNRALAGWAREAEAKRLYDEIVMEQISQIILYSETLVALLGSYNEEFISFPELQNLCQSILSNKTFTQYPAQLGCRPVITTVANIHSVADSLVWFCICNDSEANYPFDFLTDSEYVSLEKAGVMLYTRSHFARLPQDTIEQTILRVRKLTLIETDFVRGETIKRHPLMILLNEICDSETKIKVHYPLLGDDLFASVPNIDNREYDEAIRLDGFKIPLRKDAGSHESYSSLELLLQHPFDYVCEYIAKLKDNALPSASDLNPTIGTVAHLLIQKYFEEPDPMKRAKIIGDEYPQFFDEAINICGLLLLQPQYRSYFIELRKLMPDVIRNLEDLILRNKLKVIGCELQMKGLKISDNLLDSIADMVLEDELGNPVIFDFKWTDNVGKYEKLVEEKQNLQLAIYSALRKTETGREGNAAYILLPSFTIISSGPSFLSPTSSGFADEIIVQAVNGYEFRKRQFAEGVIERAENRPLEESEYGSKETEENLFPLPLAKDDLVKKSYKDFSKLK